ncbi:hypothetical protein JCM11641_007636 [Rhodosporidiobolus odoratus]
MAIRKDRISTALRPLALSQGSLSRADGSAQFTFGNVAVLASVTGPAEVKIRDELVDRATLEINVRPLRGVGGPHIKTAEQTLSALLAPLILLHLYPRALIQLTLQTTSYPNTAFNKPFSTDPSLSSSSLLTDAKGKGRAMPRDVGAGAGEKAARINAAVMALVDAGVQCRGMLVAVAVAYTEDEEMLLDPSPAEEQVASSVHVFAFSFGQGVGGVEGICVGLDSVGTFTEDQLFDAEDLAQTACQTILAFIRRSVETKYGVKGAPPPTSVKPGQDLELGSAGGSTDDSDDEVMIDG